MPTDLKPSLAPAAAALDGTEIFPCTQAGASVGATAAQAKTFALAGADHGNLAGLGDDDHAQYALLAGRSGGTTQIGGTAAGNSIFFKPNSVDNIGSIVFQRGADGASLFSLQNAQNMSYRNLAPGVAGSAFIRFTVAPSATTPNISPNDNDANTGVGAAGTGQLSLIAGSTEIARASKAAGAVSAGLQSLRPVEANTAVAASPNLLATYETRTLFTNEAATAENYHTLPSAAPGFDFEFYSIDSDGMRIAAAAGDEIEVAGTVSAVAGFIRLALNASVLMRAVNATRWKVIASTGTITVDA
jgi:hypothetical protein